MSENDIQVWFCLNPDCKKKMDFLDMKYVNLNGKCPYCYCTDFNVKIYELKRDIEVKDCKKCVHFKSEANPDYFGGCEFCFRRNDLSDFYTEGVNQDV